MESPEVGERVTSFAERSPASPGATPVGGEGSALGALRVDSSASGTTFDVVFPLASTPPALPAQRDGPAANGSGCILVVDDEAAIVNLMRRVLPRRGYDVVAVHDAEEALRRFRETPDRFTAVITDRTMPRMTGDALAAAVRAIRPTMPVVISSGQGAPVDDGDPGAQTIVALAKPFDVADLMAALERAQRCAPQR